MKMAAPVPTEIKKTDFTEITVRWDDGHVSEIGRASCRERV